jgi:4-amino-4-deoxy-L-arabinose transferase-like glycosyltransferase/putative flippase GtrA
MNIAVSPLSKLFSITLGKFLTVGVINTAVTMAVIFMLKAWLNLGDVVANACGYVAGMCCSFFLNKLWTFSHKGNTLQAGARFVLVCGIAYLVNLAVLKSTLNLGLNSYLCHVLAMPFYTLVFFIGSKAVVFVKYNNNTVDAGSLPADAAAGIRQGLDITGHDAPKNHGLNLFLFLLTLVVSTIVLFYRLTDNPIELWDESRLANNALEMSKSGLSLITTYEWLPDHWNTKPPLLIWLMAVCMNIVGINELGVRLPSVLASLGTIVLVYWFVANYLRRPVQAYLAVAIILASPGYILVHGARSGNYDSLLTLLTTAYLLCAFIYLEGEAKNKRMHFFLMMSAVVLAFYTKTIQGLIFLPAVFLYALFARKIITVLKRPHFYVGCIVAVGLCILYYWYRNQIDPGYFEAVKANDLGGRYANALEGHHGSPFWYLFRVKYFPWLVPSLIIAAYMLVRGSRPMKYLIGFLAIAMAFYLAVISSAGTKLVWYAMPLVPLYAIICAVGIAEVAGKLGGNRRPPGTAVYMTLGIASAAAVIAINVTMVNHSIARKAANPVDQQSFALRSILQGGERFNPRPAALAVLHPGYPVAPGFPFYVAPTLFYANALTIAGTPTTIVQHAAQAGSGVPLLICDGDGPVPEGRVKIALNGVSKCALHMTGSSALLRSAHQASGQH